MHLPEALQLEDGIFYYILPKGYKLFRGDNILYFSDKLPPKMTFFSISADAVEKYGMTFEFELERPYKLLALDHPSTKQILYQMAPLEIQNIMENNYGFHTTRRNSDGEKDRQLASYLCENGFEGYATNMMTNVDDFIGDFHVEVVLCDPSHVKMMKQITPEEKRIFKMEEVKLRELGENQRRRSSKPLRGEVPKFRMFYDEENDSEEINNKNGFIGKRLFGGKKRKTKSKKNNKRTTKKRRNKTKQKFYKNR